MEPSNDRVQTADGIIEVPIDPMDLLQCDSCQ